MSVRRFIIAALSAVALSAAVAGGTAGAVTAPAHGKAPIAARGSAMIPGVSPDTFWSVCDFKAVPPNKCLTYHADGAVLTNENFNGDQNNQHFLFVTTNACGGGRVTSTCPFDVGSGNNTRFQNDLILTLHAESFSNECGDGFGNGNGVLAGACSGVNGTNWVQDGTFAFVNVFSTNQSASNTPGYLTGGNNHTAIMVHGGFVEGYSQWGGES